MRPLVSVLVLTILLSVSGCGDGSDSMVPRNYRQDMRTLVQDISQYARSIDSGFIIVPQNGQELITADGTINGQPVAAYLEAVDGIGREALFYGYAQFNQPTADSVRDHITAFLDIAKSSGKTIMVTDYCSTPSRVDDSYLQNYLKDYVSFAADNYELYNLPVYPREPLNKNNRNIFEISEANNFLFLKDSDGYISKENFIGILQNTNYDMLIIDPFFLESNYSADDLSALKIKSNGGSRLVLAYMSIGAAETHRYYWKEEWYGMPPYWVEGINTAWPGNYFVQYWDSEWRNILFGGNDSYLGNILSAGFDGVYLDFIEAYKYFE